MTIFEYRVLQKVLQNGYFYTFDFGTYQLIVPALNKKRDFPVYLAGKNYQLIKILPTDSKSSKIKKITVFIRFLQNTFCS
jgi:hypothetical protein